MAQTTLAEGNEDGNSNGHNISMEKEAINAIDGSKSLEGHKNEPVVRF